MAPLKVITYGKFYCIIKFLAELKLVSIASFRLLVSHVVSVSCNHTQTLFVSLLSIISIILPTLPLIIQLSVMTLCHEHINSPAT